MATNKKNFILHSEQKEVFEALLEQDIKNKTTDCGELIVHIFKYCNDEDPEDPKGNLYFPWLLIKSKLKKDLTTWKTRSEANSKNGRKGAEARKKTLEAKKDPLKEIPNQTNIIDQAAEVEKKPARFNFRKELENLGADKELVSDWLTVRKNKKASNTKTAFNKFRKQLALSKQEINIILQICVEKSWSGFEHNWLEASDLAPIKKTEPQPEKTPSGKIPIKSKEEYKRIFMEIIKIKSQPVEMRLRMDADYQLNKQGYYPDWFDSGTIAPDYLAAQISKSVKEEIQRKYSNQIPKE